MKEESYQTKEGFNDHLIKTIREANNNITHNEFVRGVTNGTLGFKVVFGEPSQLLSGKRLIVFNLMCLCYLFAPLIIVPIVAYYQENWWLLFGIIFSYVASYSISRKSKIFQLFTPIIVAYWIINGFNFNQNLTFFYFASTWGYVFFVIADRLQFVFALHSLIESSELFDNAVENNKIIILDKELEIKRKNVDDFLAKSINVLNIADENLINKNYSEAVIEYTKAIDIYPTVSGYENRGIAKMKLEDYEGAILDFSKAIELMPSNPNKIKFANIYLNRGESKYQLGLIDEADLDFIESIRLREN
ncbi:MAG: tetratricopeptide repeat protein [Flavobacterium sp.]